MKTTKKLENRLPRRTRLDEESQQTFYSSWIFSAIHLWTTTSPEGVTTEQIASRLGLQKARVQAATRFLADVGLITARDFRWQVALQSTFLEHGSPHLNQHHRNWRLRAIDKVNDLSSDELMYTAQVTLSRADFARIREELVRAIDVATKIVTPSPAEDLACLHIDWFWL